MTVPQHIVYGVGGTLTLNVATLPAAATVTVKTDTGSALVTAASATISSIDTTLSSAAARGARTIAVADATGVTSGAEIRLQDPPEVVRCKSLSGTTVTLWRPLLHAHASGTVADGITVTYAVQAADADALFFDGRAEWTLDSALADITSVECTRYPLKRPSAISASDLADELPDLHQILGIEDDSEALLDEAHAEVLERIGGKARVHVYTGSNGFKRACVFAACVRIFRRRPGDQSQQLYERYMEALTRAIDDLQGYVPNDADQDGIVEEGERQSQNTGRIYRA